MRHSVPDMVPPGKELRSAAEMYCFGPDKLLELGRQVHREPGDGPRQHVGLLDPAQCFDHLVLRLRRG